MGAVETLIVWEALETQRLALKNTQTNAETVVFLNNEKEDDTSYLTDKETGVDLEVVDKQALAEWIVQHYKDYGTSLEFVTNW